MSEEIALAGADRAHIERLQEQLNHQEELTRYWQGEAMDLLGELCQASSLVAGVRCYVMDHRILIGECVAWNVLKHLLEVGQSQEADRERWESYKKCQGTAYADYGKRGTKR